MSDDSKRVNPQNIDAGSHADTPFDSGVAGNPLPDSKRRRGSSHAGAHAKAGQSAYIHKSTRMRKILIVVSILLVALIAALGVVVFHLVTTAQDAAIQQTNISVAEDDDIDAQDSDPDSRSSAKKTTVPDLVPLLGSTLEPALEQIGHGAEVTRTLEVNEEGNPIKQSVQLTLTEEPSDSRAGTPTVYLDLDEEGCILQVGYSAAMSALGYGTLSFSDAVVNEHVVEETLIEAGLSVSYGAAALPEDKTEYSTYDTDGTTLVKEYCAFEGVGTASGAEHQWEAILSYDYSMANATDNLNDTIRTIYVYVS